MISIYIYDMLQIDFIYNDRSVTLDNGVTDGGSRDSLEGAGSAACINQITKLTME